MDNDGKLKKTNFSISNMKKQRKKSKANDSGDGSMILKISRIENEKMKFTEFILQNPEFIMDNLYIQNQAKNSCFFSADPVNHDEFFLRPNKKQEESGLQTLMMMRIMILMATLMLTTRACKSFFLLFKHPTKQTKSEKLVKNLKYPTTYDENNNNKDDKLCNF